MKPYQDLLPRPYVGITDFEGPSQVLRMIKELNTMTTGMIERPALKAGLMTCPHKIFGLPLPKWAETIPELDELADMFPPYETPGLINAIHYADFRDPVLVPEHQNFFHGLARTMERVPGKLHAIQLDACWPDVGQALSAVEAHRHPVAVILQVSKRSFEVANNDPDEIAQRLLDYTDLIDAVLLDHSMGQGKLLNAKTLAPTIRAIRARQELSGVRIGVAGKLSGEPEDLNEFNELAREFPDLSCDAQACCHVDMDASKPISESGMKRYVLNYGATLRAFGKKVWEEEN